MFILTSVVSIVFLYCEMIELAIYLMLSFVCMMLIMCANYLTEIIRVISKAVDETATKTERAMPCDEVLKFVEGINER